VSDDLKFMSHVEAAATALAVHPARIVLLGIPADRPETEYGWIEPEKPREPGPAQLSDVLPVRSFWEKPSPERRLTSGATQNGVVTRADGGTPQDGPAGSESSRRGEAFRYRCNSPPLHEVAFAREVLRASVCSAQPVMSAAYLTY
jgi:hypothetical protein